MSTVGNTYLTLADQYKRQNPRQYTGPVIIEMLAELNEVMEDASCCSSVMMVQNI